MKTPFILAALLATAVATGCHNHAHDPNEHGTEEEHVHDAKLQLTAYDNQYELFTVATPFIAG